MKCEICHKANAQTAIVREDKDGEEQELYVCNKCAKQERLQQREHEAGELPEALGALANAFKGLVTEIEAGVMRMSEEESPDKSVDDNWHTLELDEVPAEMMAQGLIQLEGLFLIGELNAVKRALHALDMRIVGIEAGGVSETGHAYKVRYSCNPEIAKRILKDLIREERNARNRLYHELPRILGDAIGRALAILKHCRLLSDGEFFDMLAPLRLASIGGFLGGITRKRIEQLIANMEMDTSGQSAKLSTDERDEIDGKRADVVNEMMCKVELNDAGEEKFL